MEILTKLTKRNLKLNKKRTIGTIIGIVLSVALICALSGMFTSFQETLIQNAINERGNYHIAFETINREQLSKYELNKDIKFISSLYELGESKYINSSEDNPYITVYSIEKQDFDNLSYTVTEGSFPKNSNEIVISKKMALKSKLKVGDYIELNIGTRKTIDGVELGIYNPYQGEDNEFIENPTYKKYKIVGISYRERNNSAIYGITTNVENDEIHAYITLKNPKDYKQSFVELLNVDDYDDIRFSNINEIGFDFTINDELLRWQVFAFSDSTIAMFMAIAGVVVSIIIVVSVFCIRNSFAISTTEKTKMYGMLASVGATKNQIKKSVILEGLILGLIGIPVGIICGFVAVFILIKIVNLLLGDFLFNNNDGIIFKMSLIPVIASVILGYVTIYLSSISSARRASSVSPIESLRGTLDVKITSNKLKTPKIINTFFKTGGVIAYKNLKRSKKKYRTTVVSLTVSIFVFIAMFSFINESFVMTNRYYTDYKYNVGVKGIRNYSDDEIEQLRDLDNINESYILYENMYSGKIKDKDNKKVGCIINTLTQITSQDPIITISLNKENHTTEVIKETNKFAISILSIDTSKEIIGNFGYYTSKEKDKFININYEEIENIPIVKENICGYIIAEVINIIDCNTHNLILAKVLSTKEENKLTPMTYKYYHEKLKGTSPKNAPTYIKEENKETTSSKYQCLICGFIYDDAKEKIKFEDLPDDWKCPLCGATKSQFKKI